LEGERLQSFGDFPYEYSNYEDSRIAILPVPFDKTCTWKKGASEGPSAIMSASRHLEFYDIDTDSEVYRLGIWTAPPLVARSPEEMVGAVCSAVERLTDAGKFVVVIGGEHTVAFPSVKAHVSLYPDLSVLHLDAHTDMRDTYMGSKWNHACVMARIGEVVNTTVSAGIRSMDITERDAIERERIIFADEILNDREGGWIDRANRLLTDDVYITVDLDVFDPSIMPSTGTPEPGGIGWYEVLSLMKQVFAEKNVVGFDIVELSPTGDHAADFTAAKLIYVMLSYKFFCKNK